MDHCGPRAQGFGRARGLVIGMTFVRADGSIIRVGGRVVKNVAGYDLSKALIGSLGTLGIIAEVIFKVRPVSETQRSFLASFKSAADALNAAQQVLRSQLEPVALCVLDEGLEPLHVLFDRTVRGIGDDP